MNYTMDFTDLFGKEIAYIKYEKEIYEGRPCFIIWTKCGTVFGFKYDVNEFRRGPFRSEFVLKQLHSSEIERMLELERNVSLVKDLYRHNAISKETHDFYVLPIREREKLQVEKYKKELEEREREMLKRLKAKYEGQHMREWTGLEKLSDGCLYELARDAIAKELERRGLDND